MIRKTIVFIYVLTIWKTIFLINHFNEMENDCFHIRFNNMENNIFHIRLNDMENNIFLIPF